MGADEFQAQQQLRVTAVENSVQILRDAQGHLTGMLEKVLRTAPEQDAQVAEAAAQASTDKELDSLRNSLLRQQDLQSKVVESLWTDAGGLRERLEGQQGLLFGLQQQMDLLVSKLTKDPT